MRISASSREIASHPVTSVDAVPVQVAALPPELADAGTLERLRRCRGGEVERALMVLGFLAHGFRWEEQRARRRQGGAETAATEPPPPQELPGWLGLAWRQLCDVRLAATATVGGGGGAASATSSRCPPREPGLNYALYVLCNWAPIDPTRPPAPGNLQSELHLAGGEQVRH